jgi:hypothetical protein
VRCFCNVYLQERHEWACKLETLLEERGIIYGEAEQYRTLLVYLLDGLKKCSSSVISGSKVNTTLHRRLQRVLEHMQTNKVYLSVEDILELFETLLFVHDYQTSKFVVLLLRQGKKKKPSIKVARLIQGFGFLKKLACS